MTQTTNTNTRDLRVTERWIGGYGPRSKRKLSAVRTVHRPDCRTLNPRTRTRPYVEDLLFLRACKVCKPFGEGS